MKISQFFMGCILIIIFILTTVLFGEVFKPPAPRTFIPQLIPQLLPPANPPGMFERRLNLFDLLFLQPPRIVRFNYRPPHQKTAKKNKHHPHKYYQEMEDHGNDPQNSHDHQVIISLTEKYKKLVELQNELDKSNEPDYEEFKKAGLVDTEIKDAKAAYSINEFYTWAVDFLKKKYVGDRDNYHKNIKILEDVLNEIGKGAEIKSVDPEGVKEGYILMLIWLRINHPDNAENCENLKEVLLNQILDCVQTTQEMLGDLIQIVAPIGDTPHVVCLNGRVARIISSLSLLDKDPILAKPELDENEITNLAYMKSSMILQKNLKKLIPSKIKSQNVHGETMEDIYVRDPEKLTETEKELLEQFEHHVKKEITRTLNKEYKEIVSSNLLEKMIEKSLAGV